MKRKNYISEYLSDESLAKIVDSISEIEKKTSGEIRVCLKKKTDFRQRKKNPREIALKEFYKSGMHNTKDRTGILLFVIFDEHKFEILADEGIDSKISPEIWKELTGELRSYFKNEKYLDGILSGLNKLGKILIEEFPISPGDKNELSNEILTG